MKTPLERAAAEYRKAKAALLAAGEAADRASDARRAAEAIEEATNTAEDEAREVEATAAAELQRAAMEAGQ